MSSELLRNWERSDKGVNKAETATDTARSHQSPTDTSQAMLEKSIREGQAKHVVDLVGHPEVSLNYREVTNDLQTPLMRLCHAKLGLLPAHNSGCNESEQDDLSRAADSSLDSAADDALLHILQAVDRCRMAESGQLERVNLDVQDALKRTLAMHACVSQNEVMLSWALARGCNVLAADREGRNVLHYAACSGSEAILDLVLDHEHGLNALQTLDFQGYSPVDLARQRRYTGAVKRLVAALRSKDTGPALPPGPPSILHKKRDLVVRLPFPHHQTITQPRKSPHKHDDSSGRTLGTDKHRHERSENTLSQQTSEFVAKGRNHSHNSFSPNRTLNPINRSAQFNASASPTQPSSLLDVENQFAHHDKQDNNDLVGNKVGLQRIGNLVNIQHSSSSTDIFKSPLARIPARNEDSPREAPAETSPQQLATLNSDIWRDGVSPNRTLVTPNSRHNRGYPLEGSSHAFRKLQNSELASETCLSPLSPRPRQKTLQKGDNDSKSTFSAGTTTKSQSDFYITKQVSEAKVDLLSKRHQAFHTDSHETDTEMSDSTDGCVFEEEFVLDASGSKRYTGNERQKPAGVEPGPDLRRRRRNSLSLPDLRDMTGQLVTSREVSPIFTSSASPRAHRAAGDSRPGNNQSIAQGLTDLDKEEFHYRQHKDQGRGCNSHSNLSNSGHQRSSLTRKKLHGDVHQGDVGSSLPDINIGVPEKQ